MASVLGSAEGNGSRHSAPQNDRKKTASHLFFIVVVTLIFYARTFDNYWIKDDLAIGNFFVGGDLSWNAWLRELWPSYMKSEHYWRPIPLLPGFIEYRFWGLNPAGYHLDNTLMHAVAACLLYFLSNRLTGNRSPLIGFLAALLFAINPINAEAVVWVMQRMVLMCLIFSVCGILCWLNAAEGRSRLWRLLGILFLALALLSKEIALTLPGLFFLIDIFYGKSGKGAFKRAFLWALPSAVVLVTYFACRYLMWGQVVNTYAGLEPFEYARVNHVWTNMISTLGFGVAPANLGVFGGAGTASLRGVMMATFGFAFLRAIVLAKTNPTWRKLAAFSCAVFVLGLLPILPIVWIDERLFNARFFYQPVFGFLLLIAASLLLPFRPQGLSSHLDVILGRIAAGFLVVAMAISLAGGLTAFDHGAQQVRGVQMSTLEYSDSLEAHGESGKTIVVLYTPTQYAGVPTLEYSLELALRPPLAPRRVSCIPLLSRDFLTPGKWISELTTLMTTRKIKFEDLRWVECSSDPLGVRPLFGGQEPALGPSPAVLLSPANYSFLSNAGPEPEFRFRAPKGALTFHIRFAVRDIEYSWGPNLVQLPHANFSRDADDVVTYKPSFLDPSQPELPNLWKKMMQQPLRNPVPMTWRVESFDKAGELIGISRDFRLVILNAL